MLRQLELAEQAARDRLVGRCELPPALAQLFASIAASEATHVPCSRQGRCHRPAAGQVRAGNGAAADLAALQAVLAAEQAASYGYGVVGAHLSAASEAHRDR